MNKEEIQEALKIIREPITVNCIEYKYFTQENYDKLARVYENCRWFIDNWEQFEQNVEYQKKKIDRLTNIINEIEAIVYANISNIDARISIQEVLDKLKELKENNE